MNMQTAIKDITDNLNLSELYDTDYYAWIMINAKLLKEKQFDKIDYKNLAEEIEDLGKSEYHRLESHIANLLSHLYKWDNQEESRINGNASWEATINSSVKNIKKTLKQNPSLKYKLDKAMIDAWDDAIDIIHKDTNISYGEIPEECPYTFKEATERNVIEENPTKQL